MLALDTRILNVEIEVNGVTKTYIGDMDNANGLAIKAVGSKYANFLQNECTVTLYNLDKDTQDYILTETSPYNISKSIKNVNVYAGRQSYGKALIFTGNVIVSNVSQPPDIGVQLTCMTANFLKSNVTSFNLGIFNTLEVAAQQIAQKTGLLLNYQATDQTLKNFSYSGSLEKSIASLNALVGIQAYIDNGTLVVKDIFKPLGATAIINEDTGMIGIPQFTERGLRVVTLLNNTVILGGAMQITSNIYPATNGKYAIYKLGFDLTSRNEPFYWIAEGVRYPNS